LGDNHHRKKAVEEQAWPSPKKKRAANRGARVRKCFFD
jgi:hypothetical protein